MQVGIRETAPPGIVIINDEKAISMTLEIEGVHGKRFGILSQVTNVAGAEICEMSCIRISIHCK